MKVVEHLANAKNPTISVEIIPPKRGGNIEDLHRAIESIKEFNPPFIDVTSHSSEAIYEEMPDGTFRKKVKRKKPGTFGLCAAIKYKYNIDPVPHILCEGFTREETEDALIELNYLGIENILAIKGDSKIRKPVRSDRTVNRYATDLVDQISNMNQGQYLDDDLIDAAKANFCVGVACYPEKHFESPNMKFDLQILKEKQEKGADYAVTQMFFDNEKYYEYVKAARDEGITIPIVPGLKILTRKSQLSRIPSIFHVDIPEEFSEKMMAAKTRDEERAVGVEWAAKQALDLMEKSNPYVHFYIMQNTRPFLEMMDQLRVKV